MADNNTVTLIVALGAAIGGGVIGFVSNLTLERLRARREDSRQHRIAQETAARELRDLCYQATDTAEALREARAAEASPPRRPTQTELVAAGLGLILQPHLLFASLVVCASRSGLMASAPA